MTDLSTPWATWDKSGAHAANVLDQLRGIAPAKLVALAVERTDNRTRQPFRIKGQMAEGHFFVIAAVIEEDGCGREPRGEIGRQAKLVALPPRLLAPIGCRENE